MDPHPHARWFSPGSPQGILALGFLGAGLLGGVLLAQPWAHADGPISFLDALFTSTSALCVTGLIVVDTGKDFSIEGQLVILGLIQLGGLGIITFTAFALQVVGRRLSLRSQEALRDSLFQASAAGELRTLIRSVLAVTFAIEAVGAAILFVSLPWPQGALRAAFEAAFHSVSAFSNAGFSLYSTSLVDLRTRFPVIWVVAAMVFLGGIGHPVLIELGSWIRARCLAPRPKGAVPLSTHARVVLATSGLLVLLGTSAILVTGLTGDETTAGERLSGALFQSVSARTAGFNTVDIGRLPEASLAVLIFLMFIGGSPASSAGGVKTTSLAVWVANLRARLTGREAALFDRRVPEAVLQRISLLLALAVIWNLCGLVILLYTESAGAGCGAVSGAASDAACGAALGAAAGAAGGMRCGMAQALFEQVSAFGTVGLSTGLTPALSAAGKIWIVATMYVGRLGPLTLAVWVYRSRAPRVTHPEGRLMIG